MTDQREKRIQEIRDELKLSKAYMPEVTFVPIRESEVMFLIEELERLERILRATEIGRSNETLLKNEVIRQYEELESEVSRLQVERDAFKKDLYKLSKLAENRYWERDKAITWLRGALSELDRLGDEAWNKWEKEADMLAQGEAGAYDTAEQMVEAVLSELGVPHDPLD